MKFILGDRGSGVTTDIVLEAAEFGGVIICPSFSQAEYVKGLAGRMSVDNIYAVSIQDVIDNDVLSHYPNAKIGDFAKEIWRNW